MRRENAEDMTRRLRHAAMTQRHHVSLDEHQMMLSKQAATREAVVSLAPAYAAGEFNDTPLPSKQAAEREAALGSVGYAPLHEILSAVRAELASAAKWPGFNSAHEGYAILAEEVDELWSHVKTNQKKRDLLAMRAEAIQVAAMAIKFVQMINAGRGRV